MLRRPEVINAFAQRFGLKRYLEIGVEAGVTFNEILINQKVAVDPDFSIDTTNLTGQTFAKSSDDWFDAFPGATFDCIFIDGLHLAEQALRDVLRGLNRLSSGGVMLIDDCLPSDSFAAMRSINACHEYKEYNNWPDRDWMGDVYKVVIFLHDFCEQFQYSYITDSMGIVAVWRNQRPIRPILNSLEKIAHCDYSQFCSQVLPHMNRATLSSVMQQAEMAIAGSTQRSQIDVQDSV